MTSILHLQIQDYLHRSYIGGSILRLPISNFWFEYFDTSRIFNFYWNHGAYFRSKVSQRI